MRQPFHGSELHGPVRVQRHSLGGGCAPRASVVHDYMALGFVTQGSAVVQQGARYEVEAGDVYLVPAGARHGVLESRASQAWGIGFDAAWERPAELGALLDPFLRTASGASAVVRIPASRQEQLARLCEELHRESSSGELAAQDALAQRSLLTLILTEVARASATTARAPAHQPIVGEALRFIERRCLSPISLRDVADFVRRSPSHVATTVKAATGKTVVGWIIAARLAEARRRLLYTDERVELIAEHVGYVDPTHFIRLFRREHGATPAAWRARSRARG